MNHYMTLDGELTLKSADEEQRIITGLATTKSRDRDRDFIEPGGAVFSLPIPFLWQHDSRQPIGEVIAAQATDKGIEVTVQIAKIAEEGRLKERVDEAWQSIKSGLVKGLSVGFRAKEYEFTPDGMGRIFKTWDWHELSAVTIPSNPEAAITSVEQLSDAEQSAPPEKLAATAAPHRVVALPTFDTGVKL